VQKKKCTRCSLFSCLLEDVAPCVAHTLKLQQLLVLLKTSTATMSDGMVFSICSNSSDNDDKKKESFEKKNHNIDRGAGQVGIFF
jgi:hypothetical protein